MSMATSGTDNELTEVRVREVIGASGGLSPENGPVLAARVQDEALKGEVVVDFSETGTLSSGFTNAFVLELRRFRPLDEWKRLLRFEGLDSLGRLVLSRSLRAVREMQDQ